MDLRCGMLSFTDTNKVYHTLYIKTKNDKPIIIKEDRCGLFIELRSY